MAAVKSKKPTKTPSKKLKAGKKKNANKWLILGGAAAIAIAGAVILRSSFAASCMDKSYYRGYPWVRCAYAGQLISSSGKKLKTTTINKRVYAIPTSISRGYGAKSLASTAEMKNTNNICSHLINVTRSRVKVWIRVSNRNDSDGTYLNNSGYIEAGKTGNVCTNKRPNGEYGQIWVQPVSSGVYVDSIYGAK